MTGGAAGAMLCVAAGLAAGMAVRERWTARHQLLSQTQDMLARLRLMLLQERLGLCELLEESASGLEGAMPDRFRCAAQILRREPLLSLSEAYRRAEVQIHCPGEQRCERVALRQLCSEVGSGIIPTDRTERIAREATGRLCVLLAQRASCVVRMVCGVPTVIKGDLSCR